MIRGSKKEILVQVETDGKSAHQMMGHIVCLVKVFHCMAFHAGIEIRPLVGSAQRMIIRRVTSPVLIAPDKALFQIGLGCIVHLCAAVTDPAAMLGRYAHGFFFRRRTPEK